MKALTSKLNQNYIKIKQDKVFSKIEIVDELIVVQILKSAETQFFMVKDLNSLKGSFLSWHKNNEGNQFKIHYNQ